MRGAQKSFFLIAYSIMPFSMLSTINNKGGEGNDNAYVIINNSNSYYSAIKYVNSSGYHETPEIGYSWICIGI